MVEVDLYQKSGAHNQITMDAMEDILRKHFDYRNRNSSGSVLGSLFSSIEIKTCDAAYPVTFSDLDIKYDVGLGVPFAWFWCDAIVEVVENLYRENKKFNGSRDRIVELLRECVLKFLRDGKLIDTKVFIELQ